MRTRKEGVLMEFHISRQIRKQIDFDDLLFSFSGNVIFGNVTASRKLAAKLQTLNSGGQPEKTISGPALFAMGLIDELSHALVAHYRKKTDPLVLTHGLEFLSKQIGSDSSDQLLLTFADEFP